MSTVQEEAVLWFTRMRAAGHDHPDRARFEAWLAASPAHAAAYAAFAGWFQDLDSSARCDAVADAMERRKAHRHLTRRRMLKGGAAAVLFAAIGGEVLTSASRHRTAWRLAAQTATGEVRSLPLPDGSMVTLGAASRVEIAFSRAERDVRLDSGEAIFEVAKDGDRPFVVESGKTRVTVLGTRFAVARFDDVTRVSVDHGRVQVETGSFWRRQTLLLQDGQVAETALAEGEAGPPQTVNRQAAAGFAFESGAIPFEQASLDEVAATLSRYRTAPVRVAASKPGGAPRITALVQGNNVEGFFHLLPRIASVTATTDETGAVTLGPR